MVYAYFPFSCIPSIHAVDVLHLYIYYNTSRKINGGMSCTIYEFDVYVLSFWSKLSSFIRLTNDIGKLLHSTLSRHLQCPTAIIIKFGNSLKYSHFVSVTNLKLVTVKAFTAEWTFRQMRVASSVNLCLYVYSYVLICKDFVSLMKPTIWNYDVPFGVK